MARRGHRVVPVAWHDMREWLRLCAEAINSLREGKINSLGTVTLGASDASTALDDRRIGPDSYIGLMPETANAAAEIAAGTLYVSARGKQTATLTHANNAQTDRTLTYVVLG